MKNDIKEFSRAMQLLISCMQDSMDEDYLEHMQHHINESRSLQYIMNKYFPDDTPSVIRKQMLRRVKMQE